MSIQILDATDFDQLANSMYAYCRATYPDTFSSHVRRFVNSQSRESQPTTKKAVEDKINALYKLNYASYHGTDAPINVSISVPNATAPLGHMKFYRALKHLRYNVRGNWNYNLTVELSSLVASLADVLVDELEAAGKPIDQ